MKRKFTFLIAAMALMIAIMGSGATAWGQTYTQQTCWDFTGKVTGNSSYSNSWTYDPDVQNLTVTNGANSNKSWAYLKMGGKKATLANANPCTISGPQIISKIDKITVHIPAGSLSKSGMSVNSWGVYVYSNSEMTTQIDYVAGGTITSSAADFDFTPSAGKTWSANSYYKISWDLANTTTTNGIICVDKITFYKVSGYTVTYDCNGAETGCPDPNVLQNQTAIPNPLPTGLTKTHYTFDGWFTNEECTIAAVAGANISENTTLYAKWNPEEYTITYQAGEGSGESQEDTKYYGINYEILGNDITGFTAPVSKPNFNGWLGSDEQTYAVGDIYSTNASLTLTAQWTASDLFDVVYDCNGGTENCPTDNSYEMGTEINLPDAPVYAGHTFNGWLDDAEPAVNHAAGSSYTVTGDVYFTAQWLENLTAPTFNVTGVSTGAANTYYATASVVISQSQEATIYYTTDGTTPTTSSSVYEEAIVINTTGTTVVKALAVKDGYANSAVAEQTIIIVQPNVAEFTNGIYNDLTENLGQFYTYNVVGDQVWSWTTFNSQTGAYMNGYSSGAHENEDWLISPKMVAENGKLVVSFKTYQHYSGNLVAMYSTDYDGYSAPSTATWYDLNATIASSKSWIISGDKSVEGTNIFVAIKYTSTNYSAGGYMVKDFTVKQCYPVSYDANGGEGEMEDEDSPYAVGAEVTVLDNEFTAPTGTAFDKWNTQADGSGTDYMPESTFDMGTSAVTLYAQWSDPCYDMATMAATTAEYEYINNEGSLSYNINLGSSVSALGGCDIYEYGYVYSTTEATPTLENGTKIQVGTTYETAGTPFEETAIEGATLGTTYHVCSFATNNAGTAYSAVAQVNIPAAYPTYTISYSTNGNEETQATINQGNAIGTLATPTAENIPNGYVFRGWRANDVALTDDEPTYATAETVPEADMNLKAVFAIATTNEEIGAKTWTLDGSDFSTGGYGSGTITVDNISISYTDCYQNSESIQMKKSSGALNNTTAMGQKITSVVVDVKTNSVKVYEGSATDSWTNITGTDGTYTFSDNKAYFKVTSTSSYAQVNSITVNYIGITSETTYSNFCTSVSVPSIPAEITGTTTIPSGTAYTLTTPITVKSGATLTVNGVLGNSTPSNLIIEDGGQLILNNAGVQATVKKTIAAPASKGYPYNVSNWYSIGSAVNAPYINNNSAANHVENMIPGGQASDETYNLYYLNDGMWMNYRQEGGVAGFNQLENGIGYIYSNQAATTLQFVGEVNVNDATPTVREGWNLVSNPFAQTIPYANFTVSGGTKSAGYYILNGNGAWSSELSSDIASKQGVLVNITEATTPTMTISRTSNAKDASDEKYAYVEINVANANYSDRAYAAFNEGYGLPKYDHQNAEIQKVYIPQNNGNFAIAMMDESTTLFPVSFRAMTTGYYTISLKSSQIYEGYNDFDYLHLIDNMTGEDIDMLLEGSYSFIGSPADNANRFTVKLHRDGVEENEVAVENFVYQNGSSLVVNGEGTFQLFDMLGRVVISKEVNGETVSIDNIPAGAYIVRMINNEVKTQKIVIK